MDYSIKTQRGYLYYYKGEYLLVSTIARLTGHSDTTLQKRIREQRAEGYNDIDITKLLYSVPNTNENAKKYTYQGESKTLAEWAEEYGSSYAVLSGRIKRGASIGKVLTDLSNGKQRKPQKNGRFNDSLIAEYDSEQWAKNLISSLQEMGFEGEELKREFLRRAA